MNYLNFESINTIIKSKEETKMEKPRLHVQVCMSMKSLKDICHFLVIWSLRTSDTVLSQTQTTCATKTSLQKISIHKTI